MGIWFNKRGEEYYGETEKSWWKSYIDRLFKEHKEKKPIDHPDGSVTEEKLASGSVTEVKIANDSVTDSKIGFRDVKYPIKGTTLRAGLTAHLSNLISEVDNLNNNMKINNEEFQAGLDKKADKKNSDGGFVGGENASATYGGAIGNYAVSEFGGAVGWSTQTEGGGAVGADAHSEDGFAGGNGAKTNNGGAVGSGAKALYGGAIGHSALTAHGFAGGYGARTAADGTDEHPIDAVQLGTGTNSTEKTLQVYNYTLMNADGTIPSERLSGVTLSKNQVGLGNVTNDKQATKAEFDSHISDKNNPHSVTKAQVGLGNVTNDKQATKAEFDSHTSNKNNPHSVTKAQVGLGNVTNDKQATKAEFDSHTSNKNNPHSVTKAQVGLGNVENVTTNNQTPTYTEATTLTNITSGETLSTAFGKIKKAIANYIIHKQEIPEDGHKGHVHLSDSPTYAGLSGDPTAASAYCANLIHKNIENHKTDTDNPHSVTKEQVGLGNVDNTSDLNKPISTAMRTALDGKLNVIQYSDKDLNEITRDGVYRLTYSNTGNFDKSLYNLPDGYDTSDGYFDFGYHYMYLIVTSTYLTDDAPVDKTDVYRGAQFLYTKDGLFIREIEKHTQTNGSYYFNGWYNTEADIENHALDRDNPHRVTKEQVGLGNVENKSSATIRSEITKDNVTTALGYIPTEANIKKNPNATDGDIVDKHLTVGTRGTGDIGANSFTSGINNVASGIKSASIAGNNNTISGDNSVVVGGDYNTVNKYSSVVLGGNINTVSAERAAVIGGLCNTASGDHSVVCGGRYNTTLANQLKTGHYSKDGIAGSTGGTTGDAFIIGNGSSTTDRSNAFRVAYDGNCYAATAMNSTGADYAECFEWADGNPDNEDRIGFMTAFEGDKIRFANENDPVEIIGVVSALPAVVGDNYADEWCGKYLKDKYGRLLTEHKVYEAEYRDVEAEEEIELTAEEISEIQEEITNDETLTDYEKAVKLSELPTTKTVKVTKQELVHEAYEADEYVLNPDYNADEEYIPRLKRKEYSAVGTHGKLAARDDGTCEVGGFCRSGNGGIATKSDSGFYVMERIDDETVRIYIK